MRQGSFSGPGGRYSRLLEGTAMRPQIVAVGIIALSLPLIGASSPSTASEKEPVFDALQDWTPSDSLSNQELDSFDAIDRDRIARGRLGLRRDRPYVEALQEAKSQLGLDERTGIVLSASEKQELVRRDNVGIALGRVEAAIKASADERFGGLQLDYESGGRVILWLKDATESERAAVAAGLPAGTAVDWRTPKHSLTTLKRDYETLVDSAAALGAVGVELDQAGVDVAKNRVDVKLKNLPTEDSRERISRLGSSLVVSDKVSKSARKYQFSRLDAVGRLYAGRILKATNNGAFFGNCTNAISARAADGSYYLVTAGHCGRPNYNHQLGINSPTRDVGVGRLKNQYYQQTRTACDCQLVGPIPSSSITSRVIVNDGTVDGGNLYRYTNVATDGDFRRRPACVSGYRTGIDRGTILCGIMSDSSSSYFDTREDGVQMTIDGQVWIPNTYNTVAGDSGAAFGDGGTFLGLLSGGPAESSFISRATLIERATGGAPIIVNETIG